MQYLCHVPTPTTLPQSYAGELFTDILLIKKSIAQISLSSVDWTDSQVSQCSIFRNDVLIG